MKEKSIYSKSLILNLLRYSRYHLVAENFDVRIAYSNNRFLVYVDLSDSDLYRVIIEGYLPRLSSYVEVIMVDDPILLGSSPVVFRWNNFLRSIIASCTRALQIPTISHRKSYLDCCIKTIFTDLFKPFYADESLPF